VCCSFPRHVLPKNVSPSFPSKNLQHHFPVACTGDCLFKKVTINTLSVVNNKMILDVTIMKMYVLDEKHFIAELWQHVMRVTVVNCSQKCEFGLNSYSEDETVCSIAKDDWCSTESSKNMLLSLQTL
jgi:hypothetical protein